MEANGLENIPKGKPVIFASNHTNALMDALVINYFSGKQQYFMTRGDVFKIRIIGALFRSWRMLPIFRMKDGMDTLAQNDPIMEFASSQMQKGHSMIIFPEGSHYWKRKVHPLRKGLVRMAFEVEARDPQTNLVVVPVGLYYDDMIRVNQNVLVNFGEPISIRDFQKEEMEQKTYLRFNKELREKMKQQLIHIELDDEAYEQAEQWRTELAERFLRLTIKESYRLQKEFIRVINDPEFQSSIAGKGITTLDEVLAREELATWWKNIEPRLAGPNYQLPLIRALKWPLYLFSFLHFLPLFLVGRQVLSKVKDRTFHCSVKFGLALLVQPLFSLLQGGLLAIITGLWWVCPVYMLIMPVWATLFSEWRGNKLSPHSVLPE